MENKILNGYREFILTNGAKNIIENLKIGCEDLENMDNLLEFIQYNGIYTLKGYDDYIDSICDRYQIERCYTCSNFKFKKDLYTCVSCDEWVCCNCKNECLCGFEIDDCFDISESYYD
jgi:hypothetical protein